ncbi:MAG: ZPR1 zinc finger domain-containing protein [Candidatus Freyarchaeum deiterrae]
MEEKSECPFCGRESLESSFTSLNIPYFSEIFLVKFHCPLCGYTASDFLSTRYGRPTRCIYKVKNEKELTARVIRAATGTIKIPELGTVIEPGPASQAFVTNVEGVIANILAVAETARKWTETEDEKRNCDLAIEKIKKAQTGELPFTIILEDPFGNSMIIAKNQSSVSVEELTEEELENLRTGGLMLFTPSDPNEKVGNTDYK